MTQRILTDTTSVRARVPAAQRREPRWVSLGDALSTVVDALFGRTSPTSPALPSEVLRDHDRALSDALARVEDQRRLLAATHHPVLY